LEAVAFAAAVFRGAAGFVVGWTGCSGTASGSATVGGGVLGSTFATAIELDSVRWQVSQVTIVRTSAPS
jgi:hypothetical protein